MSKVIIDYGLRFGIHAMVAGHIKSGSTWFAGSWQWTRDGERHATIDYTVKSHGERHAALKLNYRVDGEPVDYSIALVAEPCRLGGLRWFAICPHTGKRVSKLYKPPGAKRFLARTAWRGLAYRSQHIAPGFDRICHRRDRLLFGKLKSDWPELPMKPKWMRHRTFDKHVAKLGALHDAMDEALMSRFGIDARF